MYRHIEKISSRFLICLTVKMRYEVAVYATICPPRNHTSYVEMLRTDAVDGTVHL